MLAEQVKRALDPLDCVYYGPDDVKALTADRIYVGFWTDKGSCDPQTAAFLKTITDQEVFLFGTAGFGGQQAYFDKILQRTGKNLPRKAHVVGGYMCQGKMPMTVRHRYEAMLAKPLHLPNLKNMIANFDQALSHPDAQDLSSLQRALESV